MAVGIVPLVVLPSVRVEAYHAPLRRTQPSSWAGYSVNVGVALQVGSDRVQIIGDSISINGVALAADNVGSSLRVGSDTVSVSGSDVMVNHVATDSAITSNAPISLALRPPRTVVTIGAATLTSLKRNSAHSPVGYYQNLRVDVPDQPTGGHVSSVCAMKGGGQRGGERGVGSVDAIDVAVSIFTPADAMALQEASGSSDQPRVAIVVPADACSSCDRRGATVTCEAARRECAASCPCGDETQINSCVYDYCAMEGEQSVIQSCLDASVCMPPPLAPPPSPPTPPPSCTSPEYAQIDLRPACSTGGKAQVENLGGKGPDTSSPQELRFASVGIHNGRTYDLVITSRGLTPPPARHVPSYSGCNGVSNGFGMIAAHAGTAVDLRFAFKDSESGAPVTLPAFLFSVYDLEQHEMIEVNGLSSYFLRRPSSQIRDLGTAGCSSGQSATCHAFQGGARVSHIASPWSTSRLTDAQVDGSVSATFESADHFSVRWGRHQADWRQNLKDRRFWFSFTSTIVPTCHGA